jgi:hypothetical protein
MRLPVDARRWAAAGFAVALLAGVAALFWTTQTEAGHARVLALTLRVLGGRLQGRLAIERIRGNLLAGARLDGLHLLDPRGDTLLAADSAYVRYDLRTLFGSVIVLRHVELYRPRVWIQRLPGDSLWNYELVFRDTTPGDTAGGTVLRVDTLRLLDAIVRVRQPWTPSPGEDTTRLDLRLVPGGRWLQRTFRFDSLAVANLVYGSLDRVGLGAELVQARGQLALWRGEPLRIRAARGRLRLRHDSLQVRLPELRLPASRGAFEAFVRLGDSLRYELAAEVDRAALADLRWLLPRVPRQGVLRARVLYRSDGPRQFLWVDSLDVDTPGTRLRGRLAVRFGDTVQVNDTDLRARPFDPTLLTKILPFPLPVDHLRVRAATFRTTER